MQPSDESFAKLRLSIRFELSGFEVGFDKSVFAGLSKEGVVFGVAPDVGEITDALPSVEGVFLKAHVDNVDQGKLLFGRHKHIAKVQ